MVGILKFLNRLKSKDSGPTIFISGPVAYIKSSELVKSEGFKYQIEGFRKMVKELKKSGDWGG